MVHDLLTIEEKPISQHQGWNFFAEIKGKLSFPITHQCLILLAGNAFGAVGKLQQAIVKSMGSISPFAPDDENSIENGHHDKAKSILLSYLIKYYKPSNR